MCLETPTIGSCMGSENRLKNGRIFGGKIGKKQTFLSLEKFKNRHFYR
ncbi:hypothetical protein [Helicobacter pylori]|nr:hypothetical protein [Helicobacter pylori]